MPDKLILDAEYNLETKNGFLQVGVSDGENTAEINSDESIKTSNPWVYRIWGLSALWLIVEYKDLLLSFIGL